MPQYIKSHSNYVLKKRHQDISDGTIWERDITTIGGVNQFSPGQTPIYKSSNFIITVRNDGKIANQYNQTKWKENESGDTWTLENISGMTSEFEDQNDVKIVLKNDFYDFCDFAYYGSLTEMFRASINDVIRRFPGELYCTTEDVYYTPRNSQDDSSSILGKGGKLVSNPFGINIHSIKKPTDAEVLKFFADDGFKNYAIISGNDEENQTPITSWRVQYYYFDYDKKDKCYINYSADTSNPSAITSSTSSTPYPCRGDKMADITINGNLKIEAWIGDDDKVVYLSSLNGVHIRPNESFMAIFYNECDNFEKIIMDRKTTPKYKAVFSVIHDNERGFYREMEEFVFPTSYGDYNIDATSFGFNSYTNRLAEIGAYYDELFTDNLYRSMTHEAIKNFDWTHTREYNVGDEEEYVHGGEKIQKALRIFAREFDEILTYINNIKNVGRVTYDERSNVPDYFLIDEVNNKGWDTCLVYPYDLKELQVDENGNYVLDDSGNTIVIDNYNCNFQLSGDGETRFSRLFSQNTKNEIKPYSKEFIEEFKDGYFVTCCDGGTQPCYYNGSVYSYIDASGSGTTYYDSCDGKLKDRIKSYSDEKPYTYMDANNEFMRRLAINSPYILRHKGTIEGIEMLLGMFGLKSQRWVDRLPQYRKDCKEYKADYEITEYTSFTNRIEEKWDAVHQMYRIDWINSTKTIVYDYRSTSNYTQYGAQQTNYLPYQGLPISYRDEYLSATEPYIKVGILHPSSAQCSTSSETKAFKEAETNKPIRRRYLYPNFDKYEQLDGNPYFQMNGGWLAKTVEYGDDRYNFQFDVDDNIAYTCYRESGETTESGDVLDNKPIYKETVRNIKRVDNIAALLKTPINNLKEGSIYYVTNIEKNVAIINGEAFEIKYEYGGSDNVPTLRYIKFIKGNGYIKIGDELFFNRYIYVYNRDGEQTVFDLSEKPNGYEVKAYIASDDTFMCKADEDGYYSIDSFCILDNEIPTSGRTNYFIIDDPYYSNRIASKDYPNGWRALMKDDAEYIKINTITNYYEGNNAHNGNMDYDSGHEYFTYYKRLFKYAIDEDMFDERCYENFFLDLDDEIGKIGFNGLIEDNEIIRQYNPYIYKDTKIHYFGNYYKKDDGNNPTKCTNVIMYCDDENKEKRTIVIVDEESGEEIRIKGQAEIMYNHLDKDIIVNNYILNDNDNMINGSPYSSHTSTTDSDDCSGITIDEVTNQVVNNKRLTIQFNLHDKWYSKEGQCELKYLDDIVMNYLAQMIPSTTIVDVRYVSNN